MSKLTQLIKDLNWGLHWLKSPGCYELCQHRNDDQPQQSQRPWKISPESQICWPNWQLSIAPGFLPNTPQTKFTISPLSLNILLLALSVKGPIVPQWYQHPGHRLCSPLLTRSLPNWPLKYLSYLLITLHPSLLLLPEHRPPSPGPDECLRFGTVFSPQALLLLSVWASLESINFPKCEARLPSPSP